MRSILALSVVFLGVAACSSDNFTPAATDAGADAAPADAAPADAASPGFCATQAPGYAFCDDFDTAGGGASGLDANWIVTTDNGGTVSRTGARFLSPGFALESTTRPGKSAATVYRNPNAGVAGKLTLSFAVYITAGCNEAGSGSAVASLVATDSGTTPNYVIGLGLSDGKVTIYEAKAGPDGGANATSAQGNALWPTEKWVHVLFEAELGTAKVAHVSLDGGPSDDFPLKASLPLAVGLPAVSIGASTDVGRATACTIDYDDVMFRLNGK